ncbi:Aste57867_5609 [Aphanomyces stellatus]|uniref:Aste57867_5609 protein n=1 Tax=Aphanomyces stellatus TaxID=120398 RepID=A0A485KGR6_9STRA|nr:hypothetical protein As57867_005596 [Aphanomyces stellatus]VFT82655.1 Aste57867_5609 [Aphanomyces stellatus]
MGCCSSQSNADGKGYKPPPSEPSPESKSRVPLLNQIRVLCLHGFRTNMSVMQVQTVGLQQAFDKSEIDFTYLNAPHAASGPAYDDVVDFFGADGPYFEWWRVSEDNSTYRGWKDSVESLEASIRRLGPFDIIVGFSQGATMATLLTAHYQAKGRHPPYKAVILVCGLAPIDGMPPGLLEVNIPSFHILGESDPVVDAGQALVGMYSSTARHVVTHPDGHKFPMFPHSEVIFNEVARLVRTTLCPKRDAHNDTVV